MGRERHEVATTDELPPGSRALVEVDGLEMAVFNVNGDYHAVANHCVHQGGPLCEGELSGRLILGDDRWSWDYDAKRRVIHCPWHNWEFDVTTGENIKDDRYDVPTYDVEVDGEDVVVLR